MQTQQKHHFLLHCYTSAQRWTHDPAVELQEKDRDEKKKKQTLADCRGRSKNQWSEENETEKKRQVQSRGGGTCKTKEL